MYRAKHGSRHHEEQTQPRLHHRAYMQHGAASQGHDSGRLQAIAGGDSWKRRAIGPTSERFFPFPFSLESLSCLDGGLVGGLRTHWVKSVASPSLPAARKPQPAHPASSTEHHPIDRTNRSSRRRITYCPQPLRTPTAWLRSPPSRPAARRLFSLACLSENFSPAAVSPA